MTIGLRMDEAEEELGSDFVEHDVRRDAMLLTDLSKQLKRLEQACKSYDSSHAKELEAEGDKSGITKELKQPFQMGVLRRSFFGNHVMVRPIDVSPSPPPGKSHSQVVESNGFHACTEMVNSENYM